MKRLINIFSLCALLLCMFSASSFPIDSVKVIKSKHRKFIIHKVDKGEGLLSIARKYNVTVDDIKAENDNINKLKLGQKIRIPLPAEQRVETRTDLPRKSTGDSLRIKVDDSHANADSKEISLVKTHIVQQGETIYKIAAKYKITTQQIVSWNGIKNNKIDLGQELIVSGNAATFSYEKWNTTNSLTSRSVMPANILSSDTTRVEENGFAALSAENTHPVINPGTFVLVINPDNNKQCLIHIRKKAATPLNTVIGLDQQTLQQLGATGNESRIIIKYNQ